MLLRALKSVRTKANAVYTTIINFVVDTISTFLFKPATLLLASTVVADAGLGVGMLAQALGTNAAIAVVLEGTELSFTIALGIASATSVAAAAAPLLVIGAAYWASRLPMTNLRPQ